MNKQQQQNAMLKLATVRLAINHVLRSRAMQKRAEGVPQFGDPDYIAPEYEYLSRLQDTLLNSPNTSDTHMPGNGFVYGSNTLAPPSEDFGREEPMSPIELARGLSKPVGDPYYLPPSKLQELLPQYYNMYNGEHAGIDLLKEDSPVKGKKTIRQLNSLPAYGIPEIMNANSAPERFRAGQNYLLQQKAPIRRHEGDFR